MGIDGGLLIDFADTFDDADVTGVLAKEKAGMMAFDFAVSFPIFFGLLQGLNLGFG